MLMILFGLAITVNSPQHQLPDGIYSLTIHDTRGNTYSEDIYVGCIGVKPCTYCMMDQGTGIMFHVDMYVNKFQIWHQFEHDFVMFDGIISGHGLARGNYDSWHTRGYFTMEFKHER